MEPVPTRPGKGDDEVVGVAVSSPVGKVAGSFC